MKNIKNSVLVSACILLGLGGAMLPISAAHATAEGAFYYLDLTPQEKSQDAVAWKQFLAYEEREPCQHYWAPPQGFKMIGCEIHRIAPPPVAVTRTTEVTKTVSTAPAPQKTAALLPIVSSYTLYFNFGKSSIRADQTPMLSRIADEIVKYRPEQVTVSGYTDTAGPTSYNMILSQKRAKTVAAALTDKGVVNKVIDKASYGEDDLAVPTANSTPNQDNRRVVVDFRR